MTVHRSLDRRAPRICSASNGEVGPSDALVDPGTGEVVVNSLRDVVFAASAFQVIVCDHCFSLGCTSGGWVVARRYGRAIAWIPDFESVDRGDWEASMYGPPYTSTGDGSRLFLGAAISVVETLVAGHPPAAALPALAMAEAARVLREQAPGHFLGAEAGPYRVRRDLALAADPFELDEVLAALTGLLAGVDGPLVPPPRGTVPATVYLDVDGLPGWTPIGRAPGDRWVLLPFGLDSSECGEET